MMTSKIKTQFGSSQSKHDLIEDSAGPVCNNQEPDYEKPIYQKPMLIAYGDVRDITLGPTLGTAESGCAGVFRPGSGLPPGTCPPGGN